MCFVSTLLPFFVSHNRSSRCQSQFRQEFCDHRPWTSAWYLGHGLHADSAAGRRSCSWAGPHHAWIILAESSGHQEISKPAPSRPRWKHSPRNSAQTYWHLMHFCLFYIRLQFLGLSGFLFFICKSLGLNNLIQKLERLIILGRCVFFLYHLLLFMS